MPGPRMCSGYHRSGRCRRCVGWCGTVSRALTKTGNFVRALHLCCRCCVLAFVVLGLLSAFSCGVPLMVAKINSRGIFETKPGPTSESDTGFLRGPDNIAKEYSMLIRRQAAALTGKMLPVAKPENPPSIVINQGSNSKFSEADSESKENTILNKSGGSSLLVTDSKNTEKKSPNGILVIKDSHEALNTEKKRPNGILDSKDSHEALNYNGKRQSSDFHVIKGQVHFDVDQNKNTERVATENSRIDLKDSQCNEQDENWGEDYECDCSVVSLNTNENDNVNDQESRQKTFPDTVLQEQCADNWNDDEYNMEDRHSSTQQELYSESMNDDGDGMIYDNGKQQEQHVEDKSPQEQQVEDTKQQQKPVEDKKQKEHHVEDNKKQEQYVEDRKKQEQQVEDKKQQKQHVEVKKLQEQHVEDKKQQQQHVEDKKQQQQHVEDKKQQQQHVEYEKQQQQHVEYEKQQGQRVERKSDDKDLQGNNYIDEGKVHREEIINNKQEQKGSFDEDNKNNFDYINDDGRQISVHSRGSSRDSVYSSDVHYGAYDDSQIDAVLVNNGQVSDHEDETGETDSHHKKSSKHGIRFKDYQYEACRQSSLCRNFASALGISKFRGSSEFGAKIKTSSSGKVGAKNSGRFCTIGRFKSNAGGSGISVKAGTSRLTGALSSGECTCPKISEMSKSASKKQKLRTCFKESKRSRSHLPR